MIVNILVRFFEGLLRLNRSLEAVLVDLAAAYAPWAAPILPASMTYWNCINKLGFEPWVALAAGITTELIGLSAVSTAITFSDWNQTKKKAESGAPLWAAVVTGVFYMVVVITTNALLDDDPWVYKLSKGLLSSLSVCAALILSLRSSHHHRTGKVDQVRSERKLERLEAKRERHPLPVAVAEVVQNPFLAGKNGNSIREAITR